jgi:hypothetical protein
MVDLEGGSQTLSAKGLELSGVRGLAVEAELVVALLEDGRALLSRDGGARFAPITEGLAAVEAVISPSRQIWIRTRAGGLLAFQEASAGVDRCALPGSVAAIGVDGAQGVFALVLDDAGRPTSLLHAPGAARPLEGPESCVPAIFAVRGENVAYAARRGGVARRRGEGPCMPFAWEGKVTALAFVDDGGTLVAATYSDADDTTALVRLDAAGTASVVARIGPARADADGDGRVSSLAFDEARGVVWVAGGFGVAAFAIR